MVDKKSDKVMELKIERETIKATLEELKKALETREIDEEHYLNSKKSYEDALASIEAKIEDIEVEAKPVVEKKERKKVKPVREEEVMKEVELVGGKIITREIKPSIKAGVDSIGGEIRSLNSTLTSLKMRSTVSKSTLDIIKKNYDDGLVDEPTYNRLKDKYEKELNKYSMELKSIEAEIAARNAIVSKYKNLVSVQSKYKDELKASQSQISEDKRELDFIKSSKLFLISNINNYFSAMLKGMREVEKKLEASGVSIPDEAMVDECDKKIKKEKKRLAELKTKLGNFQELLSSLEKDKEKGKVNKETYSVLKAEYNKEKAKVNEDINKLESELKIIKTEVEACNNLNRSLDECKALIDFTRGSLEKIWLEDQITMKEDEIKKKTAQIQRLETKMSAKLDELESELEQSLKKVS